MFFYMVFFPSARCNAFEKHATSYHWPPVISCGSIANVSCQNPGAIMYEGNSRLNGTHASMQCQPDGTWSPVLTCTGTSTMLKIAS